MWFNNRSAGYMSLTQYDLFFQEVLPSYPKLSKVPFLKSLIG